MGYFKDYIDNMISESVNEEELDNMEDDSEENATPLEVINDIISLLDEEELEELADLMIDFVEDTLDIEYPEDVEDKEVTEKRKEKVRKFRGTQKAQYKKNYRKLKKTASYKKRKRIERDRKSGKTCPKNKSLQKQGNTYVCKASKKRIKI